MKRSVSIEHSGGMERANKATAIQLLRFWSKELWPHSSSDLNAFDFYFQPEIAAYEDTPSLFDTSLEEHPSGGFDRFWSIS